MDVNPVKSARFPNASVGCDDECYREEAEGDKKITGKSGVHVEPDLPYAGYDHHSDFSVGLFTFIFDTNFFVNGGNQHRV